MTDPARSRSIAIIVVPVVLTFLLGLVGWYIQRDKMSLEYEVVSSAPFPREQGVGRYFIISLANTGTVKLEQIQFKVDFPSFVIDTYQFADPKLVSGVSHDKKTLSGTFPLLNPKERASVTITAAGTPDIGMPSFSARAPGATATPQTTNGTMQGWVVVLAAAAFAATASALLGSLSSYRAMKVSGSIDRLKNLGAVTARIAKQEETLASRARRQSEEWAKRMSQAESALEKSRAEHERRLVEMEKEQSEMARRHKEGEPEREQLIFGMLNRAGLGHRFFELARSGEISYWRTSVFLLRGFLDDEARRDSYVAALSELVGAPNLQPSSRGFAVYLLAKMEQFRGNAGVAIKWLDECKKKSPLMYEHLMAQDPAFDLAQLRGENS